MSLPGSVKQSATVGFWYWFSSLLESARAMCGICPFSAGMNSIEIYGAIGPEKRISYSNDTRFGSWPKGLYYVAAWLQIQHLAGLGMDALRLQWEQLAFGKDLGLLDFWDKSISPLVAGFNQLISTSYFCCEPRSLGMNWSWKVSADYYGNAEKLEEVRCSTIFWTGICQISPFCGGFLQFELVDMEVSWNEGSHPLNWVGISPFQEPPQVVDLFCFAGSHVGDSSAREDAKSTCPGCVWGWWILWSTLRDV